LLADPGDARLWRLVLPDLEDWARLAGVLLLKIDPDVPADAEGVADAWAARRWRRSEEQIQFRNTMVSNLAAGEEALFAGLKHKTRYNVRLAARRGVNVRHGGAADLAAFYRLYAETGERGGFATRSFPYYRDAWSALLDAGHATVLIAEREGRPLAGVIPAAFGPTAWFLYGASATEGRRHMGAYAAQWESLRWAIERGCRRYDWWGGPDRLDERDPLWGVHRFKSGFGASWVEQLGAWDYPARPAAYALWRVASRLRRRVLRLGSPMVG
jgi:lipid II:glycine glycyltransferase (peptidoglycan interpeptide bridge formation enzyme)